MNDNELGALLEKLKRMKILNTAWYSGGIVPYSRKKWYGRTIIEERNLVDMVKELPIKARYTIDEIDEIKFYISSLRNALEKIKDEASYLPSKENNEDIEDTKEICRRILLLNNYRINL